MPKVVPARVPARVSGRGAIPYTDRVETTRDPCAVETDGLATLLERFVSDHGRRAGGSAEDVLTGAIQALVSRTELAARSLAADGRGVSDKTIRSILKRSYATTDLRTADALVTAVRRPMAFHDGTLRVVRNLPRAKEAVAACCGSWTGSWASGSWDTAPKPSALNGALSAP